MSYKKGDMIILKESLEVNVNYQHGVNFVAPMNYLKERPGKITSSNRGIYFVEDWAISSDMIDDKKSSSYNKSILIRERD